MTVPVQIAELPPLPTRAGIGWSVSGGLHAAVLATLLAAASLGWLPSVRTAPPTYLVGVFAESESEVEMRLAGDEVTPVSDTERVTAEMVTTRLQEVVDQAQQRDAEENLDELERLADRLDAVSSEAAVDELTQVFQKWTGAKPRATEPAATPVEGSFDFDTAQLYDVRRADDAGGRLPYIAVLLDADGRTLEVPMTEAEGSVAFQTFQRLKRFPLAEKLYRQITMSLLNNLVQSARAAPASPLPATATELSSPE